MCSDFFGSKPFMKCPIEFGRFGEWIELAGYLRNAFRQKGRNSYLRLFDVSCGKLKCGIQYSKSALTAEIRT